MSKKKDTSFVLIVESLEDCPHCGGKAEVRESRGMFRHGWVGCAPCGCYINWSHDPDGAIKKWNRRKGVA